MQKSKGHQTQFVIFSPAVEGIDADVVFKELWDESSQHAQRNRVPGPQIPFLGLAKSVHNGLAKQVVVAPGRVDITVTAEGDDGDIFPFLFDVAAVTQDVCNRLRRAPSLEVHPVRIAVVLATLFPVSSIEEAAARFIESVGFDPNIDNPTDLMFQVNSRASIGSTQANRLLHFATMGIQRLMFDPTGMMTSSPTMQYAARRQIDVNTLPSRAPFTFDEQIAIFNGLAEEAIRLADAGTVAALRGQ